MRCPSQKTCFSSHLTCCLLLQERYLVGSRTHVILSAATFSKSEHSRSPIIHNGRRGWKEAAEKDKNNRARGDVEQNEADNSLS